MGTDEDKAAEAGESDAKPRDAEAVISRGATDDLESRNVPIEFYVPQDVEIEYADNFNVFFSDYDFTLSFMQTQAPLIINDADWEKMGSVRAKCISRTVVPPHLIPRIINVLSENWTRFMQARQRQLEEAKNAANRDAGNTPSEGNLQPAEPSEHR